MSKGKMVSIEKKLEEKKQQEEDSEERQRVLTLIKARKLAREIFGEGAVIERADERCLANKCFDEEGEREKEIIEFVTEARNLTEQLIGSDGKWTPDDVLTVYINVFDQDTLEYLDAVAEQLATARCYLEEVYPGEPITVEAILDMRDYVLDVEDDEDDE